MPCTPGGITPHFLVKGDNLAMDLKQQNKPALVAMALFVVVLPAYYTHLAHADNWPAWRGPEGNGRSAEKTLPLKWSPTENVRWKVPLPGPGNSSPIAWGDRIFLTQALDKGTRRAVMC